mgnify:FL=1
MKKGIGKWIGLFIAVIVIFVAVVMTQRIDSQEAQNIALEQAGGGKIVAQEIDKGLLLNEYSYTVQNGENWYQVDINGFGNVEEIESGTGDGWKY